MFTAYPDSGIYFSKCVRCNTFSKRPGGTQQCAVQIGHWSLAEGRREDQTTAADGPKPQFESRGSCGAATRCSTSAMTARADVCVDPGEWGTDRDSMRAWHGMARPGSGPRFLYSCVIGTSVKNWTIYFKITNFRRNYGFIIKI